MKAVWRATRRLGKRSMNRLCDSARWRLHSGAAECTMLLAPECIMEIPDDVCEAEFLISEDGL